MALAVSSPESVPRVGTTATRWSPAAHAWASPIATANPASWSGSPSSGVKNLPALEALPLRNLTRIDHQHGSIAQGEHLLGNAAKQPASQIAAPVRADQDKVDAKLLRVLDDRAGYVVFLVRVDVRIHVQAGRQPGAVSAK